MLNSKNLRKNGLIIKSAQPIIQAFDLTWKGRSIQRRFASACWCSYFSGSRFVFDFIEAPRAPTPRYRQELSICLQQIYTDHHEPCGDELHKHIKDIAEVNKSPEKLFVQIWTRVVRTSAATPTFDINRGLRVVFVKHHFSPGIAVESPTRLTAETCQARRQVQWSPSKANRTELKSGKPSRLFPCRRS